MSLYGHIEIDGVDAFAEYGLVLLKGSMNDWVAFPELKPPFTHSWKDEHGLEVDLADRYLKEKTVSLKVLFVAESESEFWAQHKRMQAMLTEPGLRKVYYRELDKEFEVYYVKSTGVKPHTRLKKVSRIAIEMTLQFVMPDPTDTIDRVVNPTGVSLSVGNVYGTGFYSTVVYPAGASQAVRVSAISLTGSAVISGRSIRAVTAGTVRVRAEVPGSSLFDERTITVYPESNVWFADGSLLSDGYDVITVF